MCLGFGTRFLYDSPGVGATVCPAASSARQEGKISREAQPSRFASVTYSTQHVAQALAYGGRVGT
eukprot:5313707-Lingulodinium_polyedra.AAC.1